MIEKYGERWPGQPRSGDPRSRKVRAGGKLLQGAALETTRCACSSQHCMCYTKKGWWFPVHDPVKILE